MTAPSGHSPTCKCNACLAFYAYKVHPAVEGEVRTVSATGGEKGVKPSTLGYLDPVALNEIALVAGFGAKMYAAFNYLKGYEWSKSYNALQRHLMAFWGGEDYDDESYKMHLAHAAWHCMALISFHARKLGTDDRPPRAVDELGRHWKIG